MSSLYAYRMTNNSKPAVEVRAMFFWQFGESPVKRDAILRLGRFIICCALQIMSVDGSVKCKVIDSQ